MNAEDIKDVINNFLKEDLVQRGNKETVVRSGSYCNGKNYKTLTTARRKMKMSNFVLMGLDLHTFLIKKMTPGKGVLV
ncbi:hypothetical protein FHS19_007027 [Paenibacillus rhizosphaerae]|uniref:Uncharacterized protein n=1 Tax=Paenibacillus rhizosphaerae TaxID=297318 RepID=A0A839U3R4_9BACL|nr:hypothetical protein [Paenibacillus rhizosphaerae]MBB3132298.1 hypothetical protein [Paenibacillus rhizosphaerae]